MTGDESKILVDTSEDIGEIEVDVQDIVAKYDLSEDDVDYLNQEYCYDNGCCYLSVNGFYAIMSVEDYEENKDSYEFYDECLPFTEE